MRSITEHQPKLKAVWTDPPIASICSQMPDRTIPQVNVAAARDTTPQTSRPMHLFERYAVETADPYCAGCGYICESAVARRKCPSRVSCDRLWKLLVSKR
jgi:rubrerythrin